MTPYDTPHLVDDASGFEASAIVRGQTEKQPLPPSSPPPSINPRLSPDGATPIWTKRDLAGALASALPEWALASLASFRDRILDSTFPCFFAPSAERRGRVLYAFADTVDEAPDVAHIGEAIVGYLHGLTHLPQAEADTTVLVILIKPPPAARSLSDYAKDAGVLLSALHHRDEAPWPAGLPTDPDDPKWSYAFAGQALFINVSTPANIVRRSRNVGPGMALIVSPRDVFDRVAGPDEKGRKTRSTIRERTAAYDGGLPFASWSAVRYGEGSTGTERKQYVLAEDNENPIDLVLTPKPVGVCPFRRGSS